jgi:hypothetical protein
MNRLNAKVFPLLILLLFFTSCATLQESETVSGNPSPDAISTLEHNDFVTPLASVEQLRNEQTPTPLSVPLSTNTPLPQLTQQPNRDTSQINSNATPEELLRTFYEMLNQKECAAAYDLFMSQRAWFVSKEDYLTACGNNYASVEIIEIHPLSQWVAEAKCSDVVQILRESDTRRSFFIKEKWTVRPEDSEKAPPGFQLEQVVSSWVSIESEDGRWKINSFSSSPPCNDDDLKWEVAESNLSEAGNDPSPQTPEGVIRAYYRYFTGKQCLAAYNLLDGEAIGQNSKDDSISFCQFDLRTWELIQITPFFERCRADDNLWDNEIQRKFYVKIRLVGRPMFLGKGFHSGFMMEHFYDLALNVELIDGVWRITKIEPWYPAEQCYVQP